MWAIDRDSQGLPFDTVQLLGDRSAVKAVLALKRERDLLREALAFYADPLTYAGIAFFADPPCGDFMDDVSEVPWPDGGTNVKPGARARAALEASK